MTTFDDVLTWSGTSLYDAGDALKAVANKYEYVYEELTGLSTDGLEGKTAEAEAKARRILADDAMDLWTALGHSGNDLIDASTTVASLMNQAWGIKGRVEARGLTITNGTVEVPDSDQARKVAKDARTNLRLLLPSYQEEVDRLMEQVEDTVVLLQGVYDDIAGLDDTALGPRADVVNAGKQEPDPSWTRDEGNDWWTALSPEEQQDIITNNPWWIGNLNGIPMKDRDAANRVWLPIMQREIDQQVEDFEPKMQTVSFAVGSNGNLPTQSTPTPEYAALLQRQKDIHALSAMFNNPEKAKNHSLLVLDNSGDHFRAAVGSGDVDGAAHVLVYTPGMTTTVAGGLAGDDGQPGGSVKNTENIMEEVDPNWVDSDGRCSETVAGVTWLGYDAPGWGETMTFSTGTVLNDNEAEKAGPDLAGFYDGVQATHHGDPHLVAGGHSYGSTATGYALRETTAPDDVAIWGSPGATTVDASDLNMLPDHSYAAAANDDDIATSGAYGGIPTTDPDSDFTALDTDEQDGLGASSGHSNYTTPGTTSLHDLGNILGGDDPDYVDR